MNPLIEHGGCHVVTFLSPDQVVRFSRAGEAPRLGSNGLPPHWGGQAAARATLLRFGFAKTSIDDIAREAKLSRLLIYRKFKNKEEILAAAFEASAFHYPALCASTPTG